MCRGVALLLATCVIFTACAEARQSVHPDEVSVRPAVQGWLDWRGPLQAGVSMETGLVDTLQVDEDLLWTYDLAGRGTPVIAGGRVYTLGYEGEGKDLQELLVCLDEKTGELIWERRWNDFLSDVIYSRYSIGSPTIDPQSGDVYVLTTAGVLKCFSPDGDERWHVVLGSELGRLTFPNGRTGSAVVDGELVIIHIITSHWGPNTPARDRFYAFDKHTGSLVWGCTPGTGPKDSPYSHPVLADVGGRRVLYAGTGCGNVVCVDVRTGDPRWRYRLATGGVNSSPVLYGDALIAIHGKENMDSSTIGRMVSIATAAVPDGDTAGPVELDRSSERWRNDLVAFTSSLVLAGNRVYITVATGELCCVDADSGEVLWQHKLAPDQIHASALYADGKLWVPMNNGTLHVVRPSDEGAEVLSTLQLEGNCLGAPALWGGRMYVHTTSKLYCFGVGGEGAGAGGAVTTAASRAAGKPGPPVGLQVIPADALVQRGQQVRFRVRSLDALGRVVDGNVEDVSFEPPGILASGTGTTLTGQRIGVGVLTAAAGELTGRARVRVVEALPWTQDFEGFTLDGKASDGSPSARSPSSWIGVGKKWEVVEKDGSQVLRKSLDVPLFQRAMGFLGHPEMSNYTMQIDIMTDGNRRSMSTAGIINQRYLIQLKGNYQQLEVSSNVERLKESVPYSWKVGTWYTLKTRVDVAPDGSGVVRAKVWPRDEPEPEAWSIEVTHAHAHAAGSPGLYGFTPQSRFHVYVDNLSVIPNE